MRLALMALLSLLVSACGSNEGAAPSSIAVTAVAWPEADALFHQDPRWLGADGAYSIPLGADRTLWLFGDTFVATSDAHVRSQARLVRNTVAVQVGADPTTAAIQFRWREAAAVPGSFFAEDGEHWFWPGPGVRLADRLVIFLSRVRATPGQGLGFVGDGWRAVIIDNPDDDPLDWHLTFAVPPPVPAGLVPVSVLGDDSGEVRVLAQREPGDHAGFLLHYSAADLVAGNLDGGAWWDGRAYTVGATPALVLADAGPECSLHFDARLSRYVHVRSDGFGRTTIVVGLAERLEGPWPAPRSVFRPPEDDRPDAFVYAAKGHPELIGADLVVTYAANTLGSFATLVNDQTIYYPRFVKVWFNR